MMASLGPENNCRGTVCVKKRERDQVNAIENIENIENIQKTTPNTHLTKYGQR